MTVGILGGGQLGRMLALAGYPLGLRFKVLDPSPTAGAAPLSEHITADYTDTDALHYLMSGVEVVTYEFENVPLEAAEFLAQRTTVYPPPQALKVAQDRLTEKQTFLKLGIPTPLFDSVDSWAELTNAVERFGLPAVLKTRRFGYDGKGQAVIRTEDELGPAWEALQGQPLILEAFVPFERELSLIAVRGTDGQIAFYPLTENHHAGGILRLSLAPAPNLDARLQAEAEDHLTRLLEALDYIGVLTVEFFQQQGRLIANEMAPRVHNSGHWTLEGAETSQFANHLRAVLGLPLGSTAPRGYAAMLNLIGTMPAPEELLSLPGVHLHLYDKTPAPGRKLGHVNFCARDADTLQAQIEQVRALLKPGD